MKRWLLVLLLLASIGFNVWQGQQLRKQAAGWPWKPVSRDDDAEWAALSAAVERLLELETADR